MPKWVINIASILSRCLAKSQKHDFLRNPPLMSRLNSLMANRAESPSQPGNIYMVGLVNFKLPTRSVDFIKSVMVMGLTKFDM